MTSTRESRILTSSGEPYRIRKGARRTGRDIHATKYDAAEPGQNDLYWQRAVSMSARAAMNPYVRSKLRDRSRYELANNCHADGILQAKACYVVGTGPRLQVMTESREYNQEVEKRFHDWADYIGFAEKLHLLRYVQAGDGESFAVFKENRGRTFRHRIKLDLEVVEADLFSNPEYHDVNEEKHDDGIVLDDYGNVIAYKKYRQHPNDPWNSRFQQEGETLLAEHVIHLFRQKRPGQLRGIPEITPALMLFPVLRRWTLATLYAAEAAARVSGVIKSDAEPGGAMPSNPYGDAEGAGGEAESGLYEPYETIDLEPNTWLTLPEKADIHQIKAEHPASTHPMLQRAVVSEVARCEMMPYNVAAGDSSDHNFASGKLDFLPFRRDNANDQRYYERKACDPAFEHWFVEADAMGDHLPYSPFDGLPPHRWMWPGDEPIDPREAGANLTKLRSGQESPVSLLARQGKDAEVEADAAADYFGVSTDEYKGWVKESIFGGEDAAEAGSDEPSKKKELVL